MFVIHTKNQPLDISCLAAMSTFIIKNHPKLLHFMVPFYLNFLIINADEQGLSLALHLALQLS